MSDLITKNSEILFIYDAKQCNPNGDMDNENKPRMDWEAGRNLVSDVRLKRYIRDYLMEVKEEPIFVRKFGDDALKAKEALGLFKLTELDGKKEENLEIKDLSLSSSEYKEIGDDKFKLIDLRLFGATIPIEVDEGKGSSSTFTGPVQFNWGYSLNEIVELQQSNTITSHLRTGQSSKGAGVGKDYRVNFSLLAFSGGINANVAKHTKLTEDDVNLLDESVIKSIPLNRTRSKIGQTPRLYLRVELKDNTSVLNDLREYLDTEYSVKENEVRKISECTLKAKKLGEYLEQNKSNIDKVYYWKDANLEIQGLDWDKSIFEPLNY